ncbi:hypothetical protein JCM1840_002381 [Sporobolomyces johnsonii]
MEDRVVKPSNKGAGSPVGSTSRLGTRSSDSPSKEDVKPDIKPDLKRSASPDAKGIRKHRQRRGNMSSRIQAAETPPTSPAKNAIEVRHPRGQRIGYIAKILAGRLAPMLKERKIHLEGTAGPVPSNITGILSVRWRSRSGASARSPTTPVSSRGSTLCARVPRRAYDGAWSDAPSVLVLSHDFGNPKRDSVVAVYLDSAGHSREHLVLDRLNNVEEPQYEAFRRASRKSPPARQFAANASREILDPAMDEGEGQLSPDERYRRREARAAFESAHVNGEFAPSTTTASAPTLRLASCSIMKRVRELWGGAGGREREASGRAALHGRGVDAGH